jgi:hypothetical protein
MIHSPSRYLLYKDYESGLNNNLMSVELAVGLAFLTGRTLVYYGSVGEDKQLIRCRGGHYHLVPASRRHVINNAHNPTILDVLETLPVPAAGYPEFRDHEAAHRLRTLDSEVKLNAAVFTQGPAVSPDDDSLRQFAAGRTIFQDAAEDVLHLSKLNLGYYSRLFFEPTPSLHALLEKVRPKPVYRDLAHTIAAALGPFNGVHVRLTDFRKFLPQDGGTYAPTILESLQAAYAPEDLLVISTDEVENKEFFREITRAFPHHVFLDDFVAGEFGEAFQSLPYQDETTFGLICNLAMQQGKDIVGTPGSSFTGMIQRNILRHQLREKGSAPPADGRAGFKYTHSGFGAAIVPFRAGMYVETRPGTYSWNRIHLPLPEETKSWYREWPESVVSGAPKAAAGRERAAPTGPVKSPEESGMPFLANKPILWLASYPRSGNTFLRTILHQCFGLRSASLYPNDLGGNRRLEEHAGHIRHDADGRMVLPDDAIQMVKTHELSHDDKPAIYVLRHGWHASLSLREFYQGAHPLEAIIEGQHRFGTWSDHVASWNPWERPNTLLLKYEEMIADPKEMLSRISWFLKREVLNDRLPDRNEIAGVDGVWVKNRARTTPEPPAALRERFNAINHESLKKAGYL